MVQGNIVPTTDGTKIVSVELSDFLLRDSNIPPKGMPDIITYARGQLVSKYFLFPYTGDIYQALVKPTAPGNATLYISDQDFARKWRRFWQKHMHSITYTRFVYHKSTVVDSRPIANTLLPNTDKDTPLCMAKHPYMEIRCTQRGKVHPQNDHACDALVPLLAHITWHNDRRVGG